jgi:glycosyltransferase involved in cell wall biosynthesis
MTQLFVSCIMPTANRHNFIPLAIDCFLHQDYQHSELIIFDDGKVPIEHLVPDNSRIHYFYSSQQHLIGTKRNICCERANGDIIVHMDDDDWYAANWISIQVQNLIESGADITGLGEINFHIASENKQWHYQQSVGSETSWVYGATFAYWKSFWMKHQFDDMNTGEDNEFIDTTAAKIYNHKFIDAYIGIIHNNNTGIVAYESPKQKLQLSKWMKNLDSPIRRYNNYIIPIRPSYPLVTCIMPTANRAAFIPTAIAMFLGQDYVNKELVIIDDGVEPVSALIPEDKRIRYFYFPPKSTTGFKRNLACEQAKGEIIMHMDDDDWYAPDWITYSVNIFLNANSDLCGINQVQFYSPTLKKCWMTKNSNSKRPWLTGASLIYRKEFWQTHQFKDLRVGEDDDFIRNNNAKVSAHNYFEGFLSTLHPNNTSVKFFEDSKSKDKY